jgi:hypothetical protein
MVRQAIVRRAGSRHFTAFPIVLVMLTLGSAMLTSPVHVLADQDLEPTSLPSFEFHSGFWINLHHFLYLQGRIRNNPADQAKKSYTTSGGAGPAMTPAEQKNWNAALAVYAGDWSSRDLVHNGIMGLINNRLAELENCPEIAGKSASECTSGLQPELETALDEAAPIYRARWWQEQDRENRAWIDAVAPLLRGMGANVGGQLAGVYQRQWPAGGYRVDVTWYAGPEGAHTSLEPVHVTIASHEPRNQGLAAFEMLFQQASYAVAEGVSQTIARDCRQLGKPIPRNLWPALLFYTTGELIRRTLGNAPESAGLATIAGYGPYGYRNALHDHGWGDYERVLERYWQAYLDDQITFETAISRIVAVQ